MKLSTKQAKFVKMISLLVQFAELKGYQLTYGDAYRDPRCKYGHPKSYHRKRLAVDFNLFKDGVWLEDTENHTFLGEFWESLDPRNRWGGNFTSFKDGNHYEYRG